MKKTASPLKDSPAVNDGKDISRFVIKYAFYNAKRLNGAGYDTGASEFQANLSPRSKPVAKGRSFLTCNSRNDFLAM